MSPQCGGHITLQQRQISQAHSWEKCQINLEAKWFQNSSIFSPFLSNLKHTQFIVCLLTLSLQVLLFNKNRCIFFLSFFNTGSRTWHHPSCYGKSCVYNYVVCRPSALVLLLDQVIKTNMMDESIFAFLSIVLLPPHSLSDEKLHLVFLRAQQI